jgi:glycerophosphoryl diester phosphodiesterase
VKIIGHRGAKGLAPENTISSLLKALEHNVAEIECDIRVTHDGIVVLHHNRHMRDTAGKKLNIKEHNFAELLSHKPDLTTLEAAIKAVAGKAPLLLEVKPKVDIKPVIKLLAKLPPENFLLGSKSQRTLKGLHKALPKIQKVVIDPWSGVRATHRARQVGTKRLSMNKLWLWGGFVKAMSNSGYELYAYTLNSPAKARKWAEYGLKGVITDYPDLFE